MTPGEVTNLANCTPDSKPPGFGRTFIARGPEGGEARALLERIHRAWEVIASWGRWSDEELGEWPGSEECFVQLPDWLHEALRREPSFEVENWMDGLRDREWAWWSGTALGHLVKIDLSAEAMPISTWTIQFVIEKAGGTVIYRGDWIPSAEVVGRTGESA
jgi:hypothetical protein